METFSALLAICAGSSPVPGEFPARRPVTRNFDVFFDLPPNKLLSKESWDWWFETPSRPLWRHRKGNGYHVHVHWKAVLILKWANPEIPRLRWSITTICTPGVGVTKSISTVPLFFEFFSIIKTRVSYWISLLYLTGVAAVELLWHRPNMNMIK